jgi:UDPglucose 6-dehydrogenase
MLIEKGAKIKAYDPVAMDRAKAIVKNIVYEKNAYETAKGSDCLLILTEWDEFKELDIKRVMKHLKHPIIIDGRNIYASANMEKLGFVYKGVGR